ncbi:MULTISPECIES: large conductance mechanosensitive channel protein MscL [unclassified Cellulophaga]|uniref:large conductance mechanosensitive channel protein MscL n=1 Tax=unclassified Cellulophaga TaxID=2634405 RepID=UPI0026E16D39|nr:MULTISPECIES: large conductance mechanosensitive channel protein MscL [unclassified Cellulophaga]MDO6491229.1 large conductance mechanosensitive channel protein MscL [Cellulophaga sp. 2_MG-2023]MDO6495238.1 large conductance mechanosensitive channel protein MscL [Cellulophaga sp. 3_MG-2023]
MLKEFKNFIMTGNVIDFAVAVIMATALGGVINGFVNNIAMPFVGYFAGGMNFEDLHVAMDGKDYATLAAAKEAGGAVIAYGAWINTIINLLIVGFVMFIIVKAYNKTKTPPAPAAPAGPTQEELLAQIRDLLKK